MLKVALGLDKCLNKSKPNTPYQYLLAECTSKYATAISDPWAPEAEGCCVPTFPSRPSQKSTCYSRSQAVIGTAGYGFILISPCLVSDGNVAFTSTAAYTGSTMTTNTSTTGVGSVNMLNLPYTASDFTESSSESGATIMGGRLVSCGVSVQYTGTELDRGGLVYGLVEPSHNSMDGFSLSDVTGYREAVIEPNTRGKHWLSAYGQTAREVQYPDDQAVLNQSYDTLVRIHPFSRGQTTSGLTNATQGAPILGFMLTGKAGNTYEFEIIQHIEYIGYKAQSMLTPTHSDARGFEIVQQAAGGLAQKQRQNPNAPLKRLLFDGIREVAGLLRVSAPVLRRTAPGAIANVRKGVDPRVAAALVGGALLRDKGVRTQLGHMANRMVRGKKRR